MTAMMMRKFILCVNALFMYSVLLSDYGTNITIPLPVANAWSGILFSVRQSSNSKRISRQSPVFLSSSSSYSPSQHQEQQHNSQYHDDAYYESQYTAQQQQTEPQQSLYRDMESLAEWAINWGVTIHPALQLTQQQYNNDDWTLTITQPLEQGTPILTVPSHLILSSNIQDDSYLPYYDEQDMRNVYTWMSLEMGPSTATTTTTSSSTSSSTTTAYSSSFQQNYLPEFILIYKLIQEIYLDKNSRWYNWWKSLPILNLSTGLYLDDVEKQFVTRMCGQFVEAQEIQYYAFSALLKKLISTQQTQSQHIIPSGFHQWLFELQNTKPDNNVGETLFDNLIKWAFTIVFTRSWRSPNQQYAQIVPLGDLMNHHCQCTNINPIYRPADNSYQFFLTKNMLLDTTSISPESPQNLYLSYGSSYLPARYLVLFGFCDTSAPYVDAHLDFFDYDDQQFSIATNNNNDQNSNKIQWPTWLDPTQTVISTTNGAVSEEVWLAFLYKVLQETDTKQLEKLEKAVVEYDETTVDEEDIDSFFDQIFDTFLLPWEREVAMEMELHYQRLLETDFAPVMVKEQDLIEHPNLSMIVNYNLFMREIFIGVLHYVNDFLDQAIGEGCIPSESSSTKSDAVSQSQRQNSSAHEDDARSRKHASLDYTVDHSKDFYVQAVDSMRGSYNGGEMSESENTSYYGPSYRQPITDFQSKSEQADTSMNSYIRAIEESKKINSNSHRE